MSNTRYLEIVSSNRNRQLYTNPAQFTVDISQTGQKVPNLALDPVSDAAPRLFWNSSFDETTAAVTVIITGIDLTFSPSDPLTFIIQTAANDLRTVQNYYVGAILRLTDSAATPVTVRTRITAYQIINSGGAGDRAQVTVSTALPVTFPSGALAGTSAIENPSNDTSAETTAQVFIPASEGTDNFYVNNRIQNINTAETFTINAFNGTTHLATLSGNTAATWNVANNNFVIRVVTPSNTGSLIGISASQRAIQLATTSTDITGLYIGGFLRMTEPVPTAAGFSTNVAPYSQERRIVRHIAEAGTFSAHGGVGTVTFTLTQGDTISTVDSFYVGLMITDTTTGETREIATYTGATRVGTVTAVWGAGAALDTWVIRTVVLQTAFTVVPVVAVTDAYEVEGYSRDNSTPFSYSGSMVSQQEMVCYEIELLSLILPNRTLSSGGGGRITSHPYVYVELQNSSSYGSSNRGNIYSNNPNAHRMLFKAPIDDTPATSTSPFVKIDGDGMVQTIKFKPNDSLDFAVFMHNGNVFQTVDADTAAPEEPNILLQISAMFSIKRL